MKKFLISMMVFCCLLAAVDISSGYVFRYLVAHAKGGDTAPDNLINNVITDDVIVLGSSRGKYHYDPFIIEDSLAMTCYNCSRSGNGIILMYGTYRMISERYSPKMIIYDVTTGYDLLECDNYRFLPPLRYYYDRPGIAAIFRDVDKNERIKMLANIYRYNRDIIQLLLDNIRPLPIVPKGYKPLDSTMQYEPEEDDSDEQGEYDPMKLRYLERLITECEGKTRVVLTASPMYNCANDEVYEPVREMASRHGIPFINHYCDTAFTTHREYFCDRYHLNRTGATKYTQTIAAQIREMAE